MQEYIINGLLVVVALLAVILQIIGTRSSAGMTKKQKVMLWRILTATVLLLILQVLGAGAFEVFGAAAAGYVWLCSCWIIWSLATTFWKKPEKVSATVRFSMSTF